MGNVRHIEIEQRSNPILNAVETIFRRLNSALYGVSPDGKRNYNTIYGYPTNPNYQTFYDTYRRSAVAGVVVDKVVKSCWRDVPELYVGDNRVLENELNELINKGLFKFLERTDILNRIGSYSILFLGVNDGEDLKSEVTPTGSMDTLYFQTYGENNIKPHEWDTEVTSPRFGMPISYQLIVGNQQDNTDLIRQGKSEVVHYSRVVHFAEGALENPLNGRSYLEPILNNLIDILKIRGGAAEGFYRNNRQKFALKADKPIGDDAAKQAFEDEIKKFQNEQQDFMRLLNVDTQVFNPVIAEPRHAFDVAIEEVSGYTGIPVRILTGKGSGQLAGSEDRATFNGLVVDRQQAECTPVLLRALEVLSNAGLVELPEGLRVEWPPQSALSENEESEIEARKADILQKIAATRSVMGGDEIDLRSALDTFGLEGIEIDDAPLPTGVEGE